MVTKRFKALMRLKIASPYETLIALALMIIGILFLFATLSTVLSAALPVAIQVAWIVWLIVGSVMNLVGIAAGSLRIRATGLNFLAGALSVYTVAAVAGSHGGFPLIAVLTTSIALAAFLKSRRTP